MNTHCNHTCLQTQMHAHANAQLIASSADHCQTGLTALGQLGMELEAARRRHDHNRTGAQQVCNCHKGAHGESATSGNGRRQRRLMQLLQLRLARRPPAHNPCTPAVYSERVCML